MLVWRRKRRIEGCDGIDGDITGKDHRAGGCIEWTPFGPLVPDLTHESRSNGTLILIDPVRYDSKSLKLAPEASHTAPPVPVPTALRPTDEGYGDTEAGEVWYDMM